jgi:uncharacterized protein (TIGR03437 family)
MTVFSRCALAALVSALPLGADGAACVVNMPCYSTVSVVNSASYATGWLAPNTFASIFGWNLAYVTVGGSAGSEGPSGSLGGVQVLVNAQPAFVSYVSPDQVNFVIPTDLTGNSATVQLVNDGLAGPAVSLTVHPDAAPALFLNLDGITALAIHSDGTVVTQQSPAHPGELILLYATGLPYDTPMVSDFDPPVPPLPIANLAEFQVLLDGEAVDGNLISYVGATAVSVGVVEIKLNLPDGVGRNPQIRIGLDDQLLPRFSPPGVTLPVD